MDDFDTKEMTSIKRSLIFDPVVSASHVSLLRDYRPAVGLQAKCRL